MKSLRASAVWRRSRSSMISGSVPPSSVGASYLRELNKQSDRSRGFGFIKMSTVEEATRCIQELNGVVCLPHCPKCCKGR